MKQIEEAFTSHLKPVKNENEYNPSIKVGVPLNRLKITPITKLRRICKSSYYLNTNSYE